MARNQKNRHRKKKSSSTKKATNPQNGQTNSSRQSPNTDFSLDDLLLARILVMIPLQTLVSLRRVSKQWQRVIETELFASMLILKLYGYKVFGVKRKDDDLQLEVKLRTQDAFCGLMVRGLNGASILLIKRWFPNLQELYFFNNQSAPDNMLWFTQLVLTNRHAELYRFCPSLDFQEISSHPQAARLARMAALQQHWNPTNLPLDTGSLSLKHLLKFHIEHYYHSDIYTNLLSNSSKLANLSIIGSCCNKATLGELFPVRQTLTHLTIDSDRDGIGGVDLPLLDFICAMFANLNYLDLKIDETCKVHHILSRLQKLSQLNHLKLISNSSLFFYPRHMTDGIKPFYSIKSVHLSTVFEIKLVRTLQRLFPNMESIHINLLSSTCSCLRRPTDQMFGKAPEQSICQNCGEILPQLLKEKCPFLNEITLQNTQVISTDDRAVNEQYLKTQHQLNVEIFHPSFQPMARIMSSFFQGMNRNYGYYDDDY